MNFKMLSDNKAVITAYSPEESKDLGYLIGENLYPGFTILFFGGLGMGKTVVTQGIGNALGVKNVKSPTFIIVSEHEGVVPFVHADLYRLEKDSEVDFLDLENYLDQGCVLVVEWAEKWNINLTKDTFKITIEKTEEYENIRTITLEALGNKATKKLEQVISTLNDRGQQYDSTRN
ncbi:MAG: tRNA (adenosine(37)-N6)-threonylcarbamoyltransferase complex ATPase subunit type 1 TsaE [Synergistaceae bacterium]|nr:tRNA (adenosine(37)-N6)-threonylcarbamoyltransferase complex ATPase subunit type 1 TsaE [Synergistaceae bacterium]